MHTHKRNPNGFIVEEKSTGTRRTDSKEVRNIVEYKSTKTIFLLYHTIHPGHFWAIQKA